jgi:hypothetical protein
MLKKIDIRHEQHISRLLAVVRRLSGSELSRREQKSDKKGRANFVDPLGEPK